MANSELINFVKQELQKGEIAQNITSKLLSNGWQQADITDAFSVVTAGGQNSGIAQANTSSPQQFYSPVVPVETASKNPGKTEGIIGIICAVIALIFFPPIFGIVGIILGVIARKKGEKNLGLVAIVLSSVFLVVGMIIGVWAASVMKSGVRGMVGDILFP